MNHENGGSLLSSQPLSVKMQIIRKVNLTDHCFKRQHLQQRILRIQNNGHTFTRAHEYKGTLLEL